MVSDIYFSSQINTLCRFPFSFKGEIVIDIILFTIFSKGMDFTNISASDEIFVMNRLNNRPRKRLGFKTPNDVFFGKQEIALTG